MVFGNDQSRQEKMPFGAAAVCLSRRALLFCRHVCGAEFNCTSSVSFWPDCRPPTHQPSTTITAATADLAYFTLLCLLCKLYIHSLVGELLLMQVPFVAAGPLQQLHPLSFGEGISLDPLPPKEIRWVGPGCDFCVGPEDMCREINLA